MTLKDEFLDYEPVRRTRSAEVKRYSDEAASIETASPKPTRTQEKPLNETWIHKHGHTLSFAGVFLFTALVFFRPYEFSPSLFWLSHTPFWVAVATLVVFVVTQLGLENRITARTREVILIFLLLLLGLLSTPQALEPARAFDSFIEFLKVVLIFIVMVNVIRTEKRLKVLWLLVLIATCILSVNAINDYRLDRLVLHGQRIKGSIGGLFDNPNDLALHLVTMFPIALAFFFSSRNPLTKILFLIVALLIVGGLVGTFSRGGFLAFLAAGVVLLWKFARQSRWLVLLVAPPLIILFIAFAPGGYRTRLATTGDDSSMARFDDLKRSLFITSRHPLLGVGMDNYILFSNSNKASHNSYTQVASEMGIGAAVLYILFIVAPFKGLRRIEHQSFGVKPARRFYYTSIALQASLVGYMVASFFASVAYLWYIYYLVAYAICLRRIYDSALERDSA